jgi:molybdenum cofactor cytidylyltransferase
MQFGRVKLGQALGGILAHNLKTPAKLLRKGAVIDGKIYKILAAAGFDEVTIARLEPGDIPEGEAATMLGEALLSANIKRSEDVHGRVNLFAQAPGLLRLNMAKIQALNLIGEAITLATLPDYAVVAAGTMIGTLKIIPFAVGFKTMEHALALIAEGEPAFTVKPFAALKTALILTTLPQLKQAAIDTTIEVTKSRIEARTGRLLPPVTVPHETKALTAAIATFENADLILISGASAVTDRLDVAPAAVVAAGGAKIHFGMPVDPGNLICFGEIAGKPVIVLPGCARSPKLNGIDWVLDRIFAGEPVTPNAIAGMGIGGLLKDIETRPAPRSRARAAGYGAAPKSRPRIAAIILAAGSSRRTGPQNKLLANSAPGQSMITQVADNVLASAASPVIVVTGHQEERIKEALAGRDVRFVHAPDHADGMAFSLRAGIAALSESIGAALVCLGDMPLVDTGTLNRIIAAYDPAEGREIIIPVFDGQRGNPVLWGARFFPDFLSLTGDVGARQILHLHMEAICEIEAGTDAVLRDFDTPEALASLT